MEKIIWVLGSKHPIAQKSISWGSPCPNFADCDLLIINLNTLPNEGFIGKNFQFFIDAQKYIFDLLMTGQREVIIILTPNEKMWQWLPLFPIIKNVSPSKVMEHDMSSHIKEYLKTVDNCSFYIHQFDSKYFVRKTDPSSVEAENYFFTGEARDYGYKGNVKVSSRIRNRARQMIGGKLTFVIDFGYNFTKDFPSGDIYLLPPPTKCSSEEAIDNMLAILTGGELRESPPKWENKISVHGLEEVEREIFEKKNEQESLAKSIAELNDKRKGIIEFRKLLWTKGQSLENVVRDAFIFLGFPEVRKIREDNLEDWVFDFKYISEYKHAVIEVKGSDNRTSLANLTQCNKWVEDYLLDNKVVKGIFIHNQHRLEDFSAVQNKKEHFEDNEQRYAETRDICILSSHELFLTVVEKMKGNPQITRKNIEEKISKSNSICKLL